MGSPIYVFWGAFPKVKVVLNYKCLLFSHCTTLKIGFIFDVIISWEYPDPSLPPKFEFKLCHILPAPFE